MRLNSLTILALRNLLPVSLNFHSRFNFFWGENGSGKTSLLEAISLLATGRSFRTHQSHQIITFNQPRCVVSGLVDSFEPDSRVKPVRIGVERGLEGASRIKIDDQENISIGVLAKTLPLQVLNSQSYQILEVGPEFRRQFLDWMMFHVEHSFYSTWQRFKKALQQRNAALKSPLKHRQDFFENIKAWDKELVETGEIIHFQRNRVLSVFLPLFSDVVSRVCAFSTKITLEYERGWSSEYGLQEALRKSFEKDKLWGYTTVGPQKADLLFKIDGVPVKQVLSRGQLKLLISALFIARALLLQEEQARRCVFLIDDMTAELDENACKSFVEALEPLGGQVFMTGIQKEPLVKLFREPVFNAYEVKKGVVLLQ